jgi:CRISPR-associated protein Cmr1
MGCGGKKKEGDMAKLTLTLEVVTPLFLAGADGREPEMRPASFRGALRFWLRALLGAQMGNDVKALYEAESRVFGNTNGASSIVVRTAAWNDSLKKGNRRVLPHSQQKTFTQPALAEGSQFTLTLTARPGQQLPGAALAALLLLLNLGGVGKRSRRGFGSLRVIEVEPEGVDELWVKQPMDGEALAKHLQTVLNKAQSLVNVSGGSPYVANALPDYPVLSADHALILVCKHPFTHAKHPYGQAMVDFWLKVLRQSPFKENQDQFGYAKRIDVVKIKKSQRKSIRRASPLILHLCRTQAGYHLVLTALKSRLSHDPDYFQVGDWPLVEDLLKECAVRWSGEYIFGGGGW